MTDAGVRAGVSRALALAVIPDMFGTEVREWTPPAEDELP